MTVTIITDSVIAQRRAGEIGLSVTPMHCSARERPASFASPDDRDYDGRNPARPGMATMTKSNMLRVQDVRDAYRLIGECRDLGSDPALWHRRMFEGLRRLIGGPVAVGGEGRWIRPRRPVEVVSSFDVGFDARGRDLYAAYHREMGPNGDPIFRALQRVRQRHVTRTRRQLVSDRTWYRSTAYNDYLRPVHLDDRVTSLYQLPDRGVVNVVVVCRAPGERPFSPREQRLLNFFHAELGALIGRAVVSASEPRPDTLSPRLRQTLICLLQGDSEKQVAARLGLRQATTHEYVTTLYRHFRVQSRAQLMAHAIKRLARSEWQDVAARMENPPSGLT
jgi:DNA-binding CsgD family transcriptional regulator